MNTILWIAQSLLAAMFTSGGLLKIFVPKEKMIAKQPFVQDYSSIQIRLIGLAEILGAIGIIVPFATGIMPILTPIAAMGLCTIMILAIRIHVQTKETAKVVIIVAMVIITSFIAYARFNSL
ncbi:DoxX family protein [Chryseolinea sp. H1M3-3]|uniref:DoxX family protein n=1 Tax=Chryseolinea sp. H1M3-3 TaxID=3034144 RepID=UPI0023EB13C5|nr:DoxX family protein [Chryseolinea sp. H1M3-3]